MTPEVRVLANHCYLWVGERNSPMGQAKVDYDGPDPLFIWSLHRFTDPNVMPPFDEFPLRETDMTREFPGVDFLHVRIQKRIYYRSRFHQGNHWLRLEY